MRFLLVLAGLAVAAPAYADTFDIAFLVQQRVTAFECPEVNINPIGIDEVIYRVGKDMGWSKQKTFHELESRRKHQVAKHRANPEGYCSLAKELEAASRNRLIRLGLQP